MEKKLFKGSGKPGKLRVFHFAKFVSTLLMQRLLLRTFLHLSGQLLVFVSLFGSFFAAPSVVISRLDAWSFPPVNLKVCVTSFCYQSVNFVLYRSLVVFVPLSPLPGCVILPPQCFRLPSILRVIVCNIVVFWLRCFVCTFCLPKILSNFSLSFRLLRRSVLLFRRMFSVCLYRVFLYRVLYAAGLSPTILYSLDWHWPFVDLLSLTCLLTLPFQCSRDDCATPNGLKSVHHNSGGVLSIKSPAVDQGPMRLWVMFPGWGPCSEFFFSVNWQGWLSDRSEWHPSCKKLAPNINRISTIGHPLGHFIFR